MKFAFCNEMFQGKSLKQVFSTAAEIGYDGVEIAPFSLAPSVTDIGFETRQKIRQEAAEFGLEITGLHWLLVSPKGLYLNHPDHEIRRSTTQYLCDLICFCGDIGGKFVVVGSPKQRDVLPGQTFEITWDRTKKVFEECLPVAQENGVIICLEPLDDSQTNFVNTPTEAAQMVREIDHPFFRMIVDVRATICQGVDITTAIHEQRDEIAYIHFNDASGDGPGFGDTDFLPVMQALHKNGYTGYGSVEVFDYSYGAENIARKSLATLQAAHAKII